MKEYGGMEIKLHVFLISVLDWDMSSASWPGPLVTGKVPIHWDTGGANAGLEAWENRIKHCIYRDTNCISIAQPVA
jgi:hypothetical protein